MNLERRIERLEADAPSDDLPAFVIAPDALPYFAPGGVLRGDRVRAYLKRRPGAMILGNPWADDVPVPGSAEYVP